MFGRSCRALITVITLAGLVPLSGQTLVNIDFGVGSHSAKIGYAATGQSTNDFWNLYRHYDPKFVPDMPLVATGLLGGLKMADSTLTKASVAVTNAPGVWGNASGDPMFDTFIFAQNGSNITVTVQALEPGRYHFYLYGHSDPDVTGEQNSVFTLRSGTNVFGPRAGAGAAGWKASSAWQEGSQYIVFRDVPVLAGTPVIIDVAPGPNGIAVLNGLQIISRGTSPPKLVTAPPPAAAEGMTNLVLREVQYVGELTDTEARFKVRLQVESLTTNRIAAPLFQGDVAVVAPELPAALRIASSAKSYTLLCLAPGTYDFTLHLIAKITKAEPWNSISFLGPEAAIASVSAKAAAPDVEIQLLSGATLPKEPGSSQWKGFLGSDRALMMRWQSKTAEVARKSLLTVETTATAQITPTVIKFDTRFAYEILQAAISQLSIALPASQSLTRMEGEQIRDWSIKLDGDRQRVSIEFAKPVEKQYSLTLHTEQNVEATPSTVRLSPPQPLEVEHESGSFTISTDEMLADIDSIGGLRQVNAGPAALVAYRFYGRPCFVTAKLQRVEPVLTSSDRATLRVEENRLAFAHALTVRVEKAGIYTLELLPPKGFSVSDVRGPGIEDWSIVEEKLRVNFGARILGERRIDVQLEEHLKNFPDPITFGALRVISASKQTARLGAASDLGIRLKTGGELQQAREIPVSALPDRSNELLAYTADGADWKITLSAERLPARVIAEVFNLITVGDGLVGGSATIRYSLLNQGAREFKLKLPAHWKNVEFTGANIRRKETNALAAGLGADTNSVLWTIALQDKAWGGYTLVVTYDYSFDPKRATLNLAGAHPLGVERETGSVAITSAGNMELKAQAAEPLRLIDQAELSETDRAFITRPVLLAYQYAGSDFQLSATRTRPDEAPVLDAVADRTQLTTTVTEDGQMITQASFMVKNNDRQFQRFLLPQDAQLWACYVNNQPSKAERDAPWLAVSLPRGANRDEAFAVDLVYKQKINPLSPRVFAKSLQFIAPKTDMPNTYAEWQFFLPPSQRVSGFGGAMTISRENAPYTLREAWKLFVDSYAAFFRENGATAGFVITLVVVAGALAFGALRSGKQGLLLAVALVVVLFILAGMMLPALGKAKAKAQRISAFSNLKNIGLAARIWSQEHGERLPNSLDDLKNYVGSERTLLDPATGQRMIYVGGGKISGSTGVIAYSPNHSIVALGDGSVHQVTEQQFSEMLAWDADTANPPNSMAAPQAPLLGIRTLRPDLPASRSGGRAPPPPAGPSLKTALLDRMDHMQKQGGMEATAADSITLGGGGVGGAGGFGGGGIGGGGFGGAASTVTATASIPAPPNSPVNPPADAPLTAGRRSIRIDIPRLGQSFSFTKVLNLSNEPLSVKMSLEGMKAFRLKRSFSQAIAFLAGLALVWIYGRSRVPRAFPLAIGIALIIGSISSLLIAAQALHVAFIIGIPLLALLIISALAVRAWKRRPRFALRPLPGAPGASPIPPAVAGLAITLFVLASPQLDAMESMSTHTAAADATNGFAITAAAYTGAIHERVAQFDATLQISSFATNQIIPLFGRDVAIEEFSTDAKDVILLRQADLVALRVGTSAKIKAHLKLAVRTGGDVSRRMLAFAIPPALSSKFQLTIDEADASVEFPSAISFRRTPSTNETRLEAILGSGDRVDLSWTPRVKRSAEMAATAVVQNTTLVTAGGGAVNTRTALEYQISQGELRQVKVRLPAAQRLLRVEGEWIRTWELRDQPDASLLVVELSKPVAPQYRLALELESALEQLPARVKIEIPHAAGVIRESGLIALQPGEEVALAIDSTQGIQRIDSAEFARTSPGRLDPQATAYRFLKTGFVLQAAVAAVQPQVEAVVQNTVSIGFDQVTLSVAIDYLIKKAGVFQLEVALPAEYRIVSVSAPNLQQWTEKENPRLLELFLKERTVGPWSVEIVLSKPHAALAKTLEFTNVRPTQVQKITGYVSVSAEPGIAAKVQSFESLSEISAGLLPRKRSPSTNSSLLAFKFSSMDPQTAAAWKLTVSTESVESWVRAEIASRITASETVVSGHTLVKYDIQNAPLKEFFLKLPPGSTNIEISGANIRRRDPGLNWRVELQSKVRGSYQLAVTWEQPRSGGTNSLFTVHGVQALGVERETGFVIVMAKPPLQITERAASDDLKRIDVREVPEWTGISAASREHSGEVPVLVYQYLRPGFELRLDARRFEEAAILQALVDSTQMTTVVADDGQMMTRLLLNVRQNGLQYLEIELPQKSNIWSASVAGQPVRPSIQAGKILVPLENAGGSAALTPIELVFVSSERFPKTKGEVTLASPRLSVPLKNARWDLFLPPDYRYTDFQGSMNHEISSEPLVRFYSGQDYFRQESENRAAHQVEVQSFLSNARSRLAEGKLKSAGDELQQAQRINTDESGDTRRQLEGLKRDLIRSQSSNLIQAQNSSYERNAEQLAEFGIVQRAAPMGSPSELDKSDVEAAEKQAGALQHAQEVAVVAMQPLHVNLPTRGERHTFTQVLQTEVNKPMTVRFDASNLQQAGWFRKALSVLGAFLILWIFTAIAMRW